MTIDACFLANLWVQTGLKRFNGCGNFHYPQCFFALVVTRNSKKEFAGLYRHGICIYIYMELHGIAKSFLGVLIYTLPETNIAPENGRLEA